MPYIDYNAAAGGDGSIGAPYNTNAQLNGISGDRSGEVWYIKRGGVFEGRIATSGAYNFVIQDYGDTTEPKPVIDCSYAAGVWTSEGNGSYSSDGTLNDGGRQRAAIVNGVKVPDYDTRAEMEASGFGTWFDGVVTWLNIGGLDPNNQNVRCTGRDNGYYQTQSGVPAGDCVVKNIVFKWSNGSAVYITAAKSNNVFDGCEAYFSGGWAGVDSPPNGFLINSQSATRGNNNQIINCVATGCSNNCCEHQFQDNFVCENNLFTDSAVGIEPWGNNTGGSYRYNRVERIAVTALTKTGGGYTIYMPDADLSPGVTGNNTSNTFAYNVFKDCVRWLIDDDNPGNFFYNNVFDGGALAGGFKRADMILLGDGTGNEFINNIFIHREVEGVTDYTFLRNDGGVIISATTIYENNNCYWEAGIVRNVGGDAWNYNGTDYVSLTTLETAEANVSGNIIGSSGDYGVNPEWADTLYNIRYGGPMAYAGQVVGETLDVYGKLVGSALVSIGASEVNGLVENTGITRSADYDGEWTDVSPLFLSNSRYYPINEGEGVTLANKDDPSGATDATIQNPASPGGGWQ